MVGNSFGDKVAEARTVLGMSKMGAASTLGMTESLLQDIEDGLVPMNDHLKTLFEETYGIDLAMVQDGPREKVERKLMSYDAEAGILRIDDLGVRFRVGEDDNDVLFRGYSSAIRRLRRLAPSVPLRLRAADMPVLASLADLEDPELDQRARFWFGQSLEEGQSFAVLLRLSRPPETKSDVWAA